MPQIPADKLKQRYLQLREEYLSLQEEHRRLKDHLWVLEDDLLAESLVDLLNSQPLPPGSEVCPTLSVAEH
jgi:hypothetical protein